MPNIELLERTLQHIIENEEGWNQRNWRKVPGLSGGEPQLLPTMCGTAMCFAGEAIQLNNSDDWVIQTAHIKAAQEANDRPLLISMYYLLEYVYADRGDPGAIQYQHPVTRQMIWAKPASEKGREVLGLDAVSADRLFFEENTLADLTDAVAHIKEHGNLNDWDPDPDPDNDD